MTQLTENFTAEEFQCKCGCKAKMKSSVVFALQAVRTEYGKPIKITSAARCPERNAKIGGVSDSKHLTGSAIDIFCDNDHDRFELIRLGIKYGFSGFGIKSNMLHMDFRPTGAFWLYK
jgi:zinc D-Ala-D-Ala carboxypeptidase